MPDLLETELLARGVSQDLVDLVVERAAIVQFDAGKSRWKAGIDAQMIHLEEILVKGADI